MKILSSTLTMPKWQKADRPLFQVSSLPEPTPESLEQGLPMSVLPQTVQDDLRDGKPVDIRSAVPVPSE